MYFSRLTLNPQRRQAKHLVADARAMHAAVEAAFPPSMAGSETRNLWRLDRMEHEVILYVVSPQRPDLRHIQEQAGWESAPAESTDYERFLGSIQRGQRYSFRLAANPVKRQFVPGGRGRILPHVTEAQQVTWLMARAEGWGFTVRPVQTLQETAAGDVDLPPDVRVVHRNDGHFRKTDESGNRTVTQRQVTFVGSLEVLEANKLRESLTRGMGRGKAYGLGLMTLAR
ncbi:type I-E CRISPR-associated protein Cas6/Cse3/CasE [Kocuria sp.]|uniref:type I-E CRISPR-associated protein Cas6/Cse3/CasE n=1 Tax=Kocuria sp. TaxID=1871328 RepID=UPI0026E0202F|nr:type I-E CRISPR-associated protein Cas6/Cse3/CasE [Kocuria sp.]MDO5617958.1 type I-E CRISPR-associated protein Cas6/Cse3/CasE [Kocuria sp.]